MKILAFSIVVFYCLRSHSLECPPGHYVVRGHPRSGSVRSDGAVVSPTTVNSYCKKYTYPYEYAQKRFKKGVPKDWPHGVEKPGVWTESQKEQISEAVEGLPEFLLSDRVEGFYRLKKSKDYPNPASHADGIIVIYDSAFTSLRGIKRILAHELIHQSYKDLSEKEQQDYRRVTGWHYKVEPDRQFYWAGRKDGYIADDGRISHEEDFANNLEHFLFDSDKLKKVTPNAYEWIKKKYGDKLKLKDSK